MKLLLFVIVACIISSTMCQGVPPIPQLPQIPGNLGNLPNTIGNIAGGIANGLANGLNNFASACYGRRKRHSQLLYSYFR